jgi:photoprotection regulator FRP-like protein
MNGIHPAAHGFDTMRELTWSPAEKAIARNAFNQALKRELEEVMVEAKKRAEQIKQPSDLWELEKYLTDRRTQIDREFDYRYSVLITVFGNLLSRGRLSEAELHGLSHDKLDAIRRYASFELNLRSRTSSEALPGGTRREH